MTRKEFFDYYDQVNTNVADGKPCDSKPEPYPMVDEGMDDDVERVILSPGYMLLGADETIAATLSALEDS